MEFTKKERVGWFLYANGSLCVVWSTLVLAGFWQAVAAYGTSLITAAAGLGIAGLRPTTGGR
jgi:hypothetical protein